MITKLLAPRDSASPIASFNPAHRDMFRLMLPQISASLRINTNRESRLPPYRYDATVCHGLQLGLWWDAERPQTQHRCELLTPLVHVTMRSRRRSDLSCPTKWPAIRSYVSC